MSTIERYVTQGIQAGLRARLKESVEPKCTSNSTFRGIPHFGTVSLRYGASEANFLIEQMDMCTPKPYATD
ncbi:hypothetical protein TNCV_3399391 [Trichonephila clavipes]|nr:hypothetical protein TNCV_3399391 [Trichonephila clavipes]